MRVVSNNKEIVERLQDEFQKSDQQWFECGKKDGLEDVEHLSYEDFRQIQNFHQHLDANFSNPDFWIEVNFFPKNFHKLIRKRINGYASTISHDTYLVTRYLAGWVEAVRDFWYGIKDEVEEYFEYEAK